MDGSQSSSPGTSSTSRDVDKLPYLRRFRKLQKAYPALRPLWEKLANERDEGLRLIAQRHEQCQGSHSRCAILIFHDDRVERAVILFTAKTLSDYLAANPSGQSNRLLILEDTDPRMVDVLGNKLGINPHIFSEQMNTWNFTDSKSVSHRSLPSMAAPDMLFTLRCYESRTMDGLDACSHKDKLHYRARMTNAINRRKIEEWRELELKSIATDSSHLFIGRCASFWNLLVLRVTTGML